MKNRADVIETQLFGRNGKKTTTQACGSDNKASMERFHQGRPSVGGCTKLSSPVAYVYDSAEHSNKG